MLDKIASRAPASTTGTTTTQNPAKQGDSKTKINTSAYAGISKATVAGMPDLPPTKAAFLAQRGNSGTASNLAPRSAPPGGSSNPGISQMTQAQVGQSQVAVDDSKMGGEAMLGMIKETAMQQMKFQAEMGTIQSLTKMSEGLSRQTKAVGEAVKSTGAQ